MNSKKNHLNPVVRLRRLDEVDIEEKKDDREGSEILRQKKGEKGSEKSHLSPVVKLRKLDERRINGWAEVVIEEEQEDSEGSESGGSILRRGLKFSSAEEYLSFMDEDRPEVDAALQPSLEGMEEEAEGEGTPSSRVVKGYS